jgi:predicted metal-dependent hydrolase
MVLRLGDIDVEVRFKEVKNLHLSVHPPSGRVTVSAPVGSNPDVIRAFAATKLGWIRRHRARFHEQPREPVREYIDRESHYVWGKRYLLEVLEAGRAPGVEVKHRHLVLSVRPGTSAAGRQAVLEKWYRHQIRAAVPPLIAEWEPRVGVRVGCFFVQRMKTKWGSCNHRAATIRLNTELAKKPRECLEYVVVHELVHLLEPTHGVRFVALLDRLIPGWTLRRNLLNELPLPGLPPRST